MAPEAPITILIADDHQIIRDGLEALIQRQKGMAVAGKAENGLKAVETALEQRPDVVIMDIAMPDLNGIEATQKIRGKLPNTRIIAMSQHSDRHSVAAMLQAGAAGFLLKECAFGDLVHAIQTVMEDHIYLSPTITDLVVREFIDQLSMKTHTDSLLTGREREVLQLIAEGRTTKEIAHHLNLSIKTIETYMQRIKEKLNLYSIAELTKYAIRQGLSSLEP